MLNLRMPEATETEEPWTASGRLPLDRQGRDTGTAGMPRFGQALQALLQEPESIEPDSSASVRKTLPAAEEPAQPLSEVWPRRAAGDSAAASVSSIRWRAATTPEQQVAWSQRRGALAALPIAATKSGSLGLQTPPASPLLSDADRSARPPSGVLNKNGPDKNVREKNLPEKSVPQEAASEKALAEQAALAAIVPDTMHTDPRGPGAYAFTASASSIGSGPGSSPESSPESPLTTTDRSRGRQKESASAAALSTATEASSPSRKSQAADPTGRFGNGAHLSSGSMPSPLSLSILDGAPLATSQHWPGTASSPARESSLSVPQGAGPSRAAANPAANPAAMASSAPAAASRDAHLPGAQAPFNRGKETLKVADGLAPPQAGPSLAVTLPSGSSQEVRSSVAGLRVASDEEGDAQPATGSSSSLPSRLSSLSSSKTAPAGSLPAIDRLEPGAARTQGAAAEASKSPLQPVSAATTMGDPAMSDTAISPSSIDPSSIGSSYGRSQPTTAGRSPASGSQASKVSAFKAASTRAAEFYASGLKAADPGHASAHPPAGAPPQAAGEVAGESAERYAQGQTPMLSPQGSTAEWRDPFLRLDGPAQDEQSHAAGLLKNSIAHSLRASLPDREQGVEGIRAQLSEGRVTATLAANPVAAAGSLAAQIPSLHQFLSEQGVAMHRLHIEPKEIDHGGSSGEGTGQSSPQGQQGNADERHGRSAEWRDPDLSTPARRLAGGLAHTEAAGREMERAARETGKPEMAELEAAGPGRERIDLLA